MEKQEMSEAWTDYRKASAQWIKDYKISLKKHIQAVTKAGTWLGVTEPQLRIHDQSKYSPNELSYYARQFHGDKADPVAFAHAWLHHIHHNPHHWQYWIFSDGYDLNGADLEDGVIEMPTHYALEMIADWLGSSFCYTGSWNMSDWLDKNYMKIRLHSRTRTFVSRILERIEAGKIYE